MTIRVAIDAATDRLAVAAERDGRVAERQLQGARRHAGALLGLLGDALGEVGAGPPDVTHVVVADGPGSFTGLRVAFAAAKALTHDGAALLTAPSLLVRAAGAATGQAPRVMALAPALRGEAYAGAWRIDLERGIETLLVPRTIGPADMGLLPGVDLIVGECPVELQVALAQPLAGAFPPSARMLLRLADVPGGARRLEHPDTWQPEYGRPAEAQAKWERDHGRPLPDPGRPER